jgi:amino-acid N-acetyltransferase
MRVKLLAASPEHELTVRALLASCGLPTEGLAYAWPHGYAVAVSEHAAPVIGCAGIESYGRDALLRSVAVAAAQRSAAVGARLVSNRIEAARQLGHTDLYLLTTTASGFFQRLGFEAVPRSCVPTGIRGSAEFAAICPTSAAVLKCSLG